MIIKSIINYLHRSNKNTKLDFNNLPIKKENLDNEFFVDEIIQAFLAHTNNNIEALDLERFFILIDKLDVSALCEKTINKLLTHTKIGIYISDLFDKKLIRHTHIFQLVDNNLNQEFVEGLELIVSNVRKNLQKNVFDRISYFALKKIANEENLDFIVNLLIAVSKYNLDRVLKIAAFHKIQPVIEKIIYCYSKEICPNYIFQIGCQFNSPTLTNHAITNYTKLDISKVNIDHSFTYAIRNDDKKAIDFMITKIPSFAAYLSVEALCSKNSSYYDQVFHTVLNKLSGEYLYNTFQIICLKGELNKFIIALTNKEINHKLITDHAFLKLSLSIVKNPDIFKILIRYNLPPKLFQEVLFFYVNRGDVPLEFFKISFEEYRLSDEIGNNFIQQCRMRNRFDILQVINKSYLKPQVSKCLLILERDQYLTRSINPAKYLLEEVATVVAGEDKLIKEEISLLVEVLQQRLNQHHLIKGCVSKALQANLKICDVTRNKLADIVTMKLCL